MRALVDLDPMIYAAAFVAQHTRFTVTKEEQVVVDYRCRQKKAQLYHVITKAGITVHQGRKLKEVKEAMLLKYPEEEGFTTTEYLFVEPEASAIFALRAMVQGVVKDSGCTSSTLFLDGSGNFRNEVATMLKYKDGRPPKPVHYAAVREHAIHGLGCMVVTGVETDDALCMEQTADPMNTMIISVDKDLLTVPGHKYDYNLKEGKDPSPGLMFQTQENALRRFFVQLIVGDRTDNIPGLGGTKEKPGIGEAKAKKIVASYMDMRALQLHILDLYIAKFGEVYEYDSWDGKPMKKTAEEVMTEVGQLVWMQRWAGDFWNLTFIEGFVDEEGKIIERDHTDRS